MVGTQMYLCVEPLILTILDCHTPYIIFSWILVWEYKFAKQKKQDIFLEVLLLLK